MKEDRAMRLTGIMHGRAGALEYVVVAYGNGQAVAWLWPVEGVLSVVGLDFGPEEVHDDAARAELDRRARALRKAYELVAPRKLSRADVRAFPVSAVIAIRNEADQAPARIGRSERRANPLLLSDAQLLEPLDDAQIYVDALARGERTPAESISDARGVSLRTAQGRVARARKLGLLSASRPGVAGGELTDLAKKLRRQLREASQGV